MCSRPNILVIGDLMLDRYVTGEAFRLSPEAPVPVILHKGDEERPGGAANVALNLVAMGCDVTLLGVIGDDDEGKRLLKLLASPNIDITNVEVALGRPTTTKTRIIAGRNQVARIDREVTAEVCGDTAWQIKRFVRKSLQPQDLGGSFDVVVISDYAKGVVTEDLVRKAVEHASFCRDGGIPIIVDPKKRDFSAYKGVTLITPNVSEIQGATGKPAVSDQDALIAVKAVAEDCGCSVLLTRSEKGMLLCDNERSRGTTFIPSNPVSVSDVSGAGDTVVAACAAALGRGIDLEAACWLAEVAAEIAVSKQGTDIVSDLEIMDRLSPIGHLKTIMTSAREGSWPVPKVRSNGERAKGWKTEHSIRL